MLSLQIQPPQTVKNEIVAQLPGSSGFSIYCTSNLDTTGACNKVENNESISCQMVPGGVINCKQQDEPPIQCVIYGGAIGTQAYFYCTHRTDPGIRDNRINSQKFIPGRTDSEAGEATPTNVLSPISDDLKTPLTQTADFGGQIQDSFN